MTSMFCGRNRELSTVRRGPHGMARATLRRACARRKPFHLATRERRFSRTRASVGGPSEDGNGSEDLDDARSLLRRSLEGEVRMDGKELRKLVVDKWGASYDVRLSKQAGRFGKKRIYLQVMWKFLEQKSFPLTEEEYMDQLDAVAEYLNIWGVADHVRREIKSTKQQMHLSTVGAKCISIPLIDAERLEQEW